MLAGIACTTEQYELNASVSLIPPFKVPLISEDSFEVWVADFILSTFFFLLRSVLSSSPELSKIPGDANHSGVAAFPFRGPAFSVGSAASPRGSPAETCPSAKARG
jgi:hypothetical protein